MIDAENKTVGGAIITAGPVPIDLGPKIRSAADWRRAAGLFSGQRWTVRSRSPGKGAAPNHLVQYAPESDDVRTVVGRPALDQLRGHETDRAHDGAGLSTR